MNFEIPKEKGKAVKIPLVSIKSIVNKTRNNNLTYRMSFNKGVVEMLDLNKDSKIAFSIEEGGVKFIINPTLEIPTFHLSGRTTNFQCNNVVLIRKILALYNVEFNVELLFTVKAIEPYKNNIVYKLIKRED